MIDYKNNTENTIYYVVSNEGNFITCGELAPSLQVSTGNPYNIDIFATKEEIIALYGEEAAKQLNNEEDI